MERNSVGWFEIYVKDMERARKFYQAVFEVTLNQLEAPFPGVEMWCFPMFEDGPGAAGALHGALLGDQTQVLDPALPQDSLVLGIQGTLAVHEVNAIRQITHIYFDFMISC